MLASQVPPKTLEVPGEPGQTVTIRKLGSKALHDALVSHAARAVRELQARGMSLQEALDAKGGEAAVRAAGEAEPWRSYDPAVLIERAVLSWDPPRAAPAEGSEFEAWLAREIAAFTNPRLVPAERGDNDAA